MYFICDVISNNHIFSRIFHIRNNHNTVIILLLQLQFKILLSTITNRFEFHFFFSSPIFQSFIIPSIKGLKRLFSKSIPQRFCKYHVSKNLPWNSQECSHFLAIAVFLRNWSFVEWTNHTPMNSSI